VEGWTAARSAAGRQRLSLPLDIPEIASTEKGVCVCVWGYVMPTWIRGLFPTITSPENKGQGAKRVEASSLLSLSLSLPCRGEHTC
jgi:hypothetical protein